MKYIILLLLSSVASAGTATLTGIPPTQNTDGSAITDPLTFNVYRGVSGQTPTLLKSGLTTASYVDTIGPGTWCYTMSAVDATYSTEGAQSNQACKTILPPVPGKMGTTTVAGGPAYSPSIGFNKLILTAVGTAPAQKTCDPTQDVNGLNVVPRTAIKLNPGVKLSDVKTAVTLCVG